jgi:hypothetical protein
MAVQIQYTNKISAKDGINCCIYGRSGTGKTMLSASCPTPIVLSAEKGLLSLRKTNIPYIDISEYKELIDAYKWIMSSSEAKRYGTFVLDSMSEIAEVVLSEEKKKTKDGRQAHGETQQQMYQLMRQFRDIKGHHKYFIAKEMRVTEGMAPNIVTRAVPIMPSSKLVEQLPYFFDLVMHLYVGEYMDNNGQRITYRGLHTSAGPEWDAKDRSGNLDAIEQANLGSIFLKAAA